MLKRDIEVITQSKYVRDSDYCISSIVVFSAVALQDLGSCYDLKFHHSKDTYKFTGYGKSIFKVTRRR